MAERFRKRPKGQGLFLIVCDVEIRSDQRRTFTLHKSLGNIIHLPKYGHQADPRSAGPGESHAGKLTSRTCAAAKQAEEEETRLELSETPSVG